MTPTWNTPADLHRLLDECAAVRKHYGHDKAVTSWLYYRWPHWAWKWRRPKTWTR